MSFTSRFLMVVACTTCMSTTARAESRTRFNWMPGACCQIPHALSASRDTAGFAILITPYSVISAGGDLALFSVGIREAVTLRLALFGMIELESGDAYNASEDGFIGLFPVADVALWRGLNGGSLAISLDGFAERFLPENSAFEVVLTFRHESEHFTGPRDMDPDWIGVPHMGDYLNPEVALHLPLGSVDLQLRTQLKFFLPSNGLRRYTYGPGIDVIARWRATRWLHPFISLFFEHIFGGQNRRGDELVDVPHNYLFRSLIGVIFPGRRADFQLFFSLAQGHGKGLHAFEESFRFGGGFRVVIPRVDLGRCNVQFQRRRDDRRRSR